MILCRGFRDVPASFTKGFKAPSKGFGVDVRQVSVSCLAVSVNCRCFQTGVAGSFKGVWG